MVPIVSYQTRWLTLLLIPALAGSAAAEPLDRAGTQWGPALEWTLENSTCEGNPFDLAAHVTFTHGESGEGRRTGMFYAGDGAWKFRFTATQPGKWTFETASADADLHGKRGTVLVKPNPDPRPHGFITHDRNRWMWSGSQEVFVPQIVMYRSPDGFHNSPDKIDKDLQTFFVEHGFNGLHVGVLCRWFDLHKTRYDQFDDDDPNPDPRTFEALELLITRAHAAGGFVHLWAWGDEQRKMTPARWGTNGRVDQRLQRYIAARLGPLPGWTMGYGFDLWEWAGEKGLRDWHTTMHQQMGWPHLLGARSATNERTQIYEHLDFASYEQHRPDYETYVKTIETRPDKPSSSDDRYRVRINVYPDKDYDLDMTRRGLWHSTLAGGVGNIWGYLVPDAGPDGMSRPYPNRDQIRTYATFFENRFLRDMTRANHLTDGVCLKRPLGTQFVFYKEEAETIRLDLSGMSGPQRAVAVDTRKPYEEIDLGLLEPATQVWKAPHPSDWAIAVGPFARRSSARTVGGIKPGSREGRPVPAREN